MAYPQIAKVICMCPGDLQLVRRIAEWLKSIHVKGESIGVVLVKAGPLFEHSLDELEEIVNYLENNGVRKDWMGFVVSRCPQVLGLTMEELESRVKFYLDMGMNEKDFGTMVFDYPRALGFFSLEEMANKVFVLREYSFFVCLIVFFFLSIVGSEIQHMTETYSREDCPKQQSMTNMPKVFCLFQYMKFFKFGTLEN